MSWARRAGDRVRWMRVWLVIGMLCRAGSLRAEEPRVEEPPPSEGWVERLSFSGYVQGRFTHSSDVSEFGVRRGRLKLAWANDWSRYVLQVDAVPSGVTLKDAEATFIEPWSGHRMTATLGQTKVPFGFEAPQSSSAREFPERARVVRAFVPGERDRGLKAGGTFGPVSVALGVFNGNGIGASKDNDRAKDVIGRVGVDFGWVTGGVSGWWGETRAESGRQEPRRRLGADLQVDGSAVGLPHTALRAEWVMGKTWTDEGVERPGESAGGFYVVASQGIGAKVRLAARYDAFESSGREALHTLGVLALYEPWTSLRLTLAGETSTGERAGAWAAPTVIGQVQAKF